MIYKIQLSTGEGINITEQEYEKFKNNLDKSFIEFENGIVNPSFVVSIKVDFEATRDRARELQRKENNLLSEPVEKDVIQIGNLLEKYKPEFIKENEKLNKNN